MKNNPSPAIPSWESINSTVSASTRFFELISSDVPISWLKPGLQSSDEMLEDSIPPALEAIKQIEIGVIAVRYELKRRAENEN